MIKKVEFKKAIAAQNRIVDYTGIYAIDSMIEQGIIYGVSNNKFAIIGYREAIYCELEEVPKLIDRITLKDIKNEVKAIYEDIRSIDLRCFN